MYVKKIYDIFKSQKLGIIVGFTVTGLLIIGSLIMNFQPQETNPYMVLSPLYRLHYLWHQRILMHPRLDYQKGKRRHKKDSPLRGIYSAYWVCNHPDCTSHWRTLFLYRTSCISG